MTDSVVAEGQVKFREGKKWKTRWVVLRKPSPVADCLYLLVYKEKKKGREKGSCNKERLNVTLEGICGVEPGTGYDGVSYTLSIICLAHTLVLGFSSRDALLAWDSRVCYSLGEVHRFSVTVEPGTKLESGPASLHLCNNLLVLTRGVPPVIIGHWKLSALRRYGAVPNGFVFEGGTRCGVWAGVFFLSCSEGEHINFLFDCIVRGITPSRAPHGLRPALPADPNADPDSAEKRISQEASELEKRLSMLSICSLASSTASTYSFSTSVAGDDQSSISSSSSSQSDASYGSRLPYWAEPLARPHPSNETASSSSTLKALNSSDDRLYAAVMGSSSTHLSSTTLPPRALHDSGRQSSLDSGIGIATASQSSYSGSLSSFTGSLDTACQGGGEAFGSLTSLTASPPPLLPLSTPSCVPPSSPPPPSQSTLTSEQSSATSLFPCASRSSSCASSRHSVEYQIPSLLSRWYDTPRNLLQALSQRETSSLEGPPELGWDSVSSSDGGARQGQRITKSPTGLMAQCQATMQHSHSSGSERMFCVDSEESSTPRSQHVPGGLDCGEKQDPSLSIQCSHGLDNYVTPEQWRSARASCVTQIANSPSGLSSSADTQDLPVCARWEHKETGEVVDKLAGLKRTEPSRPPSAPPPLPFPLRMLSPTTIIGKSRSTHEAPQPVSLENGLQSNSTVNYVNISITPLSAKPHRESLYTELDLQGTGSVPVLSAVRRKFLQL
ncbi:protein Dok-7-like isoform X1 [Labrus mixtus]|uniref:protein Dok-7-like isoform X1 n=1 Tax=Labrus mixtus TaxID=508554 RepID=UPI0029C08DF8|nr:protein Dok-7-like isoform X1 [Labrus mixtus]